MKYLILSVIIFCCFTEKAYSQELSMFQGFWTIEYYQDNQRLSKKEFESVMFQDKQAYGLWNKSKKHNAVSIIAAGVQVGFLVLLVDRLSDDENLTIPTVGMIGSAVTSFVFGGSARKLKRDAILNYNNREGVSSILLTPTYNGFGFVLSF